MPKDTNFAGLIATSRLIVFCAINLITITRKKENKHVFKPISIILFGINYNVNEGLYEK